MVHMSRDTITVSGLQLSAGITEQSAGFSHEIVGFQLVFMFGALAFQIQPQHVAGFFDCLYGFAFVAAIVVLGHFQENIRMGQFLARRFSMRGYSDNECCREDRAGEKIVSES